MTPETRVKTNLIKACHKEGWVVYSTRAASCNKWPDKEIHCGRGATSYLEVKARGIRHNPDHVAAQKEVLMALAKQGYLAIFLVGDPAATGRRKDPDIIRAVEAIRTWSSTALRCGLYLEIGVTE
jgi:hypothetical protein